MTRSPGLQPNRRASRSPTTAPVRSRSHASRSSGASRASSKTARYVGASTATTANGGPDASPDARRPPNQVQCVAARTWGTAARVARCRAGSGTAKLVRWRVTMRSRTAACAPVVQAPAATRSSTKARVATAAASTVRLARRGWPAALRRTRRARVIHAIV